jgi:hypothetical protein
MLPPSHMRSFRSCDSCARCSEPSCHCTPYVRKCAVHLRTTHPRTTHLYITHLYIAHLCAEPRLHGVSPCICRAPHLCTWPQFAQIYLASLTLPRLLSGHLCAGPRLHRVSPCTCRAPCLCTWPQFVPICLASLTLPRLSTHLCTTHRYIAHLCAGARLHRVSPCICRAPCPCTRLQFVPIYLTSFTLCRLSAHLCTAHRQHTSVSRASPTWCGPMHLSGTVSLHMASVRADLPGITHTARATRSPSGGQTAMPALFCGMRSN